MTNPECFGTYGWVHWPDNEGLSAEFRRLLGSAQEGGATVSECFLTASRIDPQDPDSWYREWNKTAKANHERGDAALSRGNCLTAQSNWLRALSYYGAAALDFDFTDRRMQASLANMRTCARRYLDIEPLAEKSSRSPGSIAIRWRAISCRLQPRRLQHLS
jgi:hypothetical protein